MIKKWKISSLIALPAIISISLTLPLQNEKADRITGVWLTAEEKGKVKIYECGDEEYCGKIIWTQNHAEGNPPKKDKNNPDPEKRDQTILGLKILKGLEYNAEENYWEDGTIYDPEKGKEYSCYASLKNPDKLKLKGYIGMSWLGRSTYWTRLEDHPEAN